jgi:hypothetical protein
LPMIRADLYEIPEAKLPNDPRLDGSRRTLPTMDFDTLLSILDGI